MLCPGCLGRGCGLREAVLCLMDLHKPAHSIRVGPAEVLALSVEAVETVAVQRLGGGLCLRH